MAALAAPVTVAAWKTKPSWYVVATEDGAIAPELLRSTARRIGAETTEVPGSHVVFLTQPKAVADVIDAAARGAGRSFGARQRRRVRTRQRGCHMNRLINLFGALPTPDPALIVAYTPIRLEMPGRQPLELRLTAPCYRRRPAGPSVIPSNNDNVEGPDMEIGIDSFAAILPDPATGELPSATERMAELLEEVEVADRVGLDVFGIGEHHRAEFSIPRPRSFSRRQRPAPAGSG
jgi:hypothetical protein